MDNYLLFILDVDASLVAIILVITILAKITISRKEQ